MTEVGQRFAFVGVPFGSLNVNMMNDIRMQAVETLIPLPDAISYAAVIDDNDQEIEISDFMMRRACEEMDDTMEWPFAPAKAEMIPRPAAGADIIPFRRK